MWMLEEAAAWWSEGQRDLDGRRVVSEAALLLKA